MVPIQLLMLEGYTLKTFANFYKSLLKKLEAG